jgi:hypothetical protein
VLGVAGAHLQRLGAHADDDLAAGASPHRASSARVTAALP